MPILYFCILTCHQPSGTASWGFSEESDEGSSDFFWKYRQIILAQANPLVLLKHFSRHVRNGFCQQKIFHDVAFICSCSIRLHYSSLVCRKMSDLLNFNSLGLF